MIRLPSSLRPAGTNRRRMSWRTSSSFVTTGEATVTWQMANLAASLVMKSLALGGRYKEKDAYDLFYLVRHYRQGPASAVEALRPLLHLPVVQQARKHLQEAFGSLRATGPAWVANFNDLTESRARDILIADPTRQLQHLESTLSEATKCPRLRRMTLAQYLNTAAVAYDAGFRELRAFSPRQKYQKKADGRHGGLLDLPPHDATAFEQWFHSPAWTGCHPWEIVFGHPHGIMLSPRYHQEDCSWSYWLWVDALGKPVPS